METKLAIILVLAVSILVSACLGGQTDAKSSTASAGVQTTQTIVDSAPDVSVGDADLPFIGENDTVEIGEML